MRLFGIVLIICSVAAVTMSAPAAETGAVIENGSKVSFDYTLTVDGKEVDSSKGRGPVQYTQGAGQVIPGLEKQLAGMRAGEDKPVDVSPEEAYGQIDPKAVIEVSRANLPKDKEPQVGMGMQMRDKDGRIHQGTIKEVSKDKIVVDMNHPLAGKALHFQIKIVSIG